MKLSHFRLVLAVLVCLLSSTALPAANHPGLKCPTDARSGKRASVQTTHIRKKLLKQKHNAVKQAKVKTTKVHKKVSVKLPAVHLPGIHLKLPEVHAHNPLRARRRVLSKF